MSTHFNLASYFYNIADIHKARPALRYKEKEINYEDLNKLSNQIAKFLISKNIKSYDVVGILNTKQITGYATMLACLKIGATYTNLDIDSPIIRLEKIINTCQLKLLITDNDLPINIDIKNKVLLKNNIFNIKLDKSILKSFSDKNLEISKKIVGSTPAYIMFTSGSTGIPKGVTISHANVLSFLGWSIKRYKVSPKDRFAQVSPLYFDNSVFDFYTALFSGASLVPIKKETTTNLPELLDIVDSLKCTIWFSVPSFLVYLQTMRVLSNNSFQTIRIFTFGGEGFPKGELKKLYDLYGKQAEIINVYGPTEGTCICSSYDISERDFEDMNTLAPLGPINPNFEYLIVDKDMQSVKNGEKGELCLVGPNVALGYYNDITRTRENFIQNPLINSHRNIIYKCGDIVYEKDKLLWFAGRVDNQIKHMGYRIELEEIESALNSLDDVIQSAVVYDRVNANFGKIVAFVSSNKIIAEPDLISALENLLPKYMIPNIIHLRESLPKNANGKIDKKVLIED